MNKNIEELFSLSGKVAVVTGGAGLLGMQHAEILSDAGAHVVIADIKQDLCDKAADIITKRNNIESLGVEVNVSSEESVIQMLTKIKKKYNKVDILINNAAAKPKNLFNKVEDYDLEDWKKVISVNLSGVFICCKVIGKEMASNGGGTIVNIGSIYGLVGPDQRIYGDSGINAPAVYSASKGGLINLTRYLATYWGDKSIRVNSLSLGGVKNMQDPKFIERYSEKTPLGRMARKDDFKGALLFLASEASSYMTGANLVIDGGWTAW